MVRIGIIGLGNMGQRYLQEITAGMADADRAEPAVAVESAAASQTAGRAEIGAGTAAPLARVTAVCSGSREKRERVEQEMPEVLAVSAAEELLARKEVDAVVIATPNQTHAALTRQALLHGKHVLVEKPVGLSLDEIDELDGLARKAGLCFSVMFQLRVHPAFRELKRLLPALGDLERICWRVTQYYRPQSYYDGSRSWTGKWRTDGGGVLLNQAIHQLDLWQHLFGLPDEAVASVRFGAFRDIEVEDQATVMFRYRGGLTGTFLATVDEEGTGDRLEVAGRNGRAVLAGDRLTTRIRGEERSLVFSDPDRWRKDRMAVVTNFLRGIEEGTPPVSPAHEGKNSLGMVFAAWLSAWTNRWVSLPVDDRVFQQRYLALVQGRPGTGAGSAVKIQPC
ncbi:MAG: Gfo/Idh/MocA family oxidoreductase [Clostridium sp.]|jgi:predicted dehydrogenase|nr:Gfo/Idh/MocA family oxidoreductase [Clostridium sp.]